MGHHLTDNCRLMLPGREVQQDIQVGCAGGFSNE
jgi:hypothetical protein